MSRIALKSEELIWNSQNKCFLGVSLVCESLVWAVGLSEVQELDSQFSSVSPVPPEP